MEKEPYQFEVYKQYESKAYEIQRAKLERLKKERHNQEVERALARIARDTEKGENVMPAVMEAVRAYATVGEICNVWRKMYGKWDQNII